MVMLKWLETVDIHNNEHEHEHFINIVQNPGYLSVFNWYYLLFLLAFEKSS